MPIWHKEANAKLSELSKHLSNTIEKQAELLAANERSETVTNVHVEDARRILVRGEKRQRPWFDRFLCLLMECGGPLTAGVGLADLETGQGKAFVLLGFILFVASKYRD